MFCPYCECKESEVLRTLKIFNKKATIRRRECLKCKGRFTTLETIKYTSKIYEFKSHPKSA